MHSFYSATILRTDAREERRLPLAGSGRRQRGISIVCVYVCVLIAVSVYVRVLLVLDSVNDLLLAAKISVRVNVLEPWSSRSACALA